MLVTHVCREGRTVVMVSLLKLFILSTRTGDLSLQLQTIEEMIPIFHAAGHFAYAKYQYVRLHTQQMQDLKAIHASWGILQVCRTRNVCSKENWALLWWQLSRSTYWAAVQGRSHTRTWNYTCQIHSMLFSQMYSDLHGSWNILQGWIALQAVSTRTCGQKAWTSAESKWENFSTTSPFSVESSDLLQQKCGSFKCPAMTLFVFWIHSSRKAERNVIQKDASVKKSDWVVNMAAKAHEINVRA